MIGGVAGADRVLGRAVFAFSSLGSPSTLRFGVRWGDQIGFIAQSWKRLVVSADMEEEQK